MVNGHQTGILIYILENTAAPVVKFHTQWTLFLWLASQVISDLIF